jgi:prolyl oligopeptidase
VKRALLDPNTLSTDGTVALSTWSATDDGRLFGYGVETAGSDWEELRVRDVATGHDLADTIHWAKFTGIAWTKDGRGFFYARYPEPATSAHALTDRNTGHQLYYHHLGQPQSTDRLIWQQPDQPDWIVFAGVTDDGRFAIISIAHGTDPRNRLYYIDLGDPRRPNVERPLVRLVDAFEAEYVVVGTDHRQLLLRTDLDAPRGRIVRVDLDHPDRGQWHTVVPEAKDKLEQAALIGGRIVAVYLRDAQSVLATFGVDGTPGGELTLPGVGTVAAVSGRQDDPEAFYAYVSFLQPGSIYRFDVQRPVSEPFHVPTLPVDVSRFETRQIFCTGKDGTRVPVFVTARKGVALDRTNPTWLYAYGGFNVNMTPFFSPSQVAWLEMGGVWAVAVLRGGGEYGTAWHEAGMFERKQNVFDDFIAAAQCLETQGYTSPSRLAIQGESNGGLLIGAMLTQRPDLYGVALPGVGVMDMLRYQKFTIGMAWAAEYGSSDDSTQFRYLIKYSPLHNIRAGTHYPATLIMTSDHDDRVVPGHSFKFGAALQAAQAGPAPVLIRIETRAGHGAGKPTSKQIDLAADEMAFVVKNLGVKSAERPTQ